MSSATSFCLGSLRVQAEFKFRLGHDRDKRASTEQLVSIVTTPSLPPSNKALSVYDQSSLFLICREVRVNLHWTLT